MNPERNPETGTAEREKPYEPPKVVRVPLRPEEAVLGHCKISGAGGPNVTCFAIPQAPCSTPGS